MDSIIEVKVRGNHLSKDNRNAGVQYEANVTYLRIDFDASWDRYAKTVTFWDALMGNPVKVDMTTDKLEDITTSTRIYLIPIPGEAMMETGDLTFVVDGFVTGRRRRTLSDTLWVKPAPYEEEADEPTDPTPTQAEQLQVQVEQIMGTLQEVATAKSDTLAYAEYARGQADNATSAAQYSQEMADYALNMKNEAESFRNQAEEFKNQAGSSAYDAHFVRNEAISARDATIEHESHAASAAAAAEEHRNTASAAAETAVTSAETAVTSAATAVAAAEEAVQAKDEVKNFAAQDAGQQVKNHNESQEAHADIRSELSQVARAKTGGEIDQRLQNRVEKSGDTMTGILTFDTPGLFSAFQKKRTIGDKNYIMRAGIGNDGSGASACLRLFSVAADGTETVVSHIEADSSGVYWVAPGGIRKTIAHSGNIGVLSASVE